MAIFCLNRKRSSGKELYRKMIYSSQYSKNGSQYSQHSRRESTEEEYENNVKKDQQYCPTKKESFAIKHEQKQRCQINTVVNDIKSCSQYDVFRRRGVVISPGDGQLHSMVIDPKTEKKSVFSVNKYGLFKIKLGTEADEKENSTKLNYKLSIKRKIITRT